MATEKIKEVLAKSDWLRIRELHTLVLDEAHEQTTLDVVALLSGFKRLVLLYDPTNVFDLSTKQVDLEDAMNL